MKTFGGSKPDRSFWLGLSVFVTLVLAGMVLVAARRGIWLDEIWSQYMAQHDVPLGRVYTERWMFDIQPPLFYFASWLFEPLTGENIVARRLINVLPMLIAGLATLAIGRRRPAVAVTVALTGVLIFGNPLIWAVLLEHRSYCGQASAWAVICAGVAAIAIEGRDYARRDRWLALIMASAIFVALNLHYFSSLIACVLLGVFIVGAWVQGLRGWAWRLALFSVLGAAVLIVIGLVQRQQMATIAGNFWVRTSTGEALALIGWVVVSMFGANIAALASGVLTVWQGAAVPGPERQRRLRLALCCAVALVAAIIVALAANAVRPVLMERYLLPMWPVGSLLVAVLAADVRRWRPLWLMLILLNAVLIVVAMAWAKQGRLKSDELAIAAGAQVRACATSKIVAVPHWAAGAATSFVMKNEPDVVALGYRELGKRYGFVPVTGLVPVDADTRCPTLIWAEHYYAQPPAPAELAARARVRVSPKSIAAATIRPSPTGIIISYPAP